MHKELEPHPAGCKRTHPPQTNSFAKVRGGFPERIASSPNGGQEGQAVTGRKPGKDLVTTNQRPSNGGRWGLGGRSSVGDFSETNNRVHAVGENHRETASQGLASSGAAARGVATHHAVPGRGCKTSPSLAAMHNKAVERDAKNATYFRRPSPLRYVA